MFWIDLSNRKGCRNFSLALQVFTDRIAIQYMKVHKYSTLDLESICNGSSKAQNFKRSFACYILDCEWTRICDPEVSKCLLWSFIIVKKWQLVRTSQTDPEKWKKEKKKSSRGHAFTIILVSKSLPWTLGKDSVSYICTHLSCTMSSQNFLMQQASRE